MLLHVGNEQLARSGSNCLENLIVSTGKQFFPDMWDRVCDCISDIFVASMPNELLTWTPPERLYRTQSNISLTSTVSTVSEAPAPTPSSRPISVTSVHSSVIEPAANGGDEVNDISEATEAAVNPEITVVPSSPPSQPSEHPVTDVATEVTPTDHTIGDIPADAPSDAPSNISGDVVNNAGPTSTVAVDGQNSEHDVKQLRQEPIAEEPIEDAPLLREETDHPGTQESTVIKPPVVKKQVTKEKKQKGTGSFLQRKKRDSSSSTSSKKKKRGSVPPSPLESSSKDGGKPDRKLSHHQSPDADLAKSKFSKIGECFMTRHMCHCSSVLYHCSSVLYCPKCLELCEVRNLKCVKLVVCHHNCTLLQQV